MTFGVILGNDSTENPANVRTYRPPYWCASCDVGQSIPNCWLCDRPCQPTGGDRQKQDGTDFYKPGTLEARALANPGTWRPDDQTRARSPA